MCAWIWFSEIKYSQLKINHLNDTPSTKAAGGRDLSGVFTQGRQGTTQGQEDFELNWYLFFQQFDQENMEAMHFIRWLNIKACLKQNEFWTEKKKSEEGYDPTQKYRLVWDVMTHNMNS